MDEAREPLSVERAIHKVESTTTPPQGRTSRTWYEVAKALYDELMRLRARHLPVRHADDEDVQALFETRRAPARYTLCEQTNKRSYPSAQLALRGASKAGHKLRSYRCPHCNGHHVTKEEYR